MRCNVCNGRGIKVTLRQLGPGMVQQMQTVCPECRGEGDLQFVTIIEFHLILTLKLVNISIFSCEKSVHNESYTHGKNEQCRTSLDFIVNSQ